LALVRGSASLRDVLGCRFVCNPTTSFPCENAAEMSTDLSGHPIIAAIAISNFIVFISTVGLSLGMSSSVLSWSPRTTDLAFIDT